ncbi:MAG: long-chain fatty acid--CoA ligase [Candidatus Dadabacteria bacterium]|nr:long-chain fatty acid--CoA ligase [Candidatus Dadabacteria bacterium]
MKGGDWSCRGVRIKKGDKVGMYMLNRSEYVISILATHKSGAVQVPINKTVNKVYNFQIMSAPVCRSWHKEKVIKPFLQLHLP